MRVYHLELLTVYHSMKMFLRTTQDENMSTSVDSQNPLQCQFPIETNSGSVAVVREMQQSTILQLYCIV